MLDLADSVGWPKGRLADALGFKQQMYVRYDAGEAVLDSAMLLRAILVFDIPLAVLSRASEGYGVIEAGGVLAARARRRADDAEVAARLAELSDPAHAWVCSRILPLIVE